MTAWRLPLRIAWRDALRSRGRSVLVLVMIALPVLGVTTADVLIQTATIDAGEDLDRTLGSAQAIVTVRDGIDEVQQAPNPDSGYASDGDGDGDDGQELTPEQLAAALDGRPLAEIRHGWAMLGTDRGATDVETTEVDLGDPLADGLFELADGRLPRTADEVVVNQALADKGYAVGDALRLDESEAPGPVVVGIAESTTVRTEPTAVGPIGSLGVEPYDGRTWLVGGGPMTWDDVLGLNELGVTAYSRAVILDPPPDDAIAPEVQGFEGSGDDAFVAVVALIVVMALLEVVLLAGPSFAVGARRQARTLALVAACGGTPTQARRVVLASAVVLGGIASAAGVVLGIGLAAALLPLVQSLNSTWLGPFDVSWLHLAGVACFGLASALLAAVVPAHLASRQDVVAVLAGRRGDRKPSLRSPLLGVALLAGGIVGAVLGARPGGELLIAASAIPAILGMVLLVPVVLGLLGRLAGRLPLSLRFAVRDAARHRTRTVPAVAAVAATVAGVVALGISTSSDAAESEATYTPSLPAGMGVVSTLGGQDTEAVRAALVQEVPAAARTEILGVPDELDDQWLYTSVTADGGEDGLLSGSSSVLGASVLVGEELPPGLRGVDRGERVAAGRMLAAGGVVAFTDRGVQLDEVHVRVSRSDNNTGEEIGRPVEATLPALVVEVDASTYGPVAVLSPEAAEGLGLEVATVGFALAGTDITDDQEEAVNEVLAATAAGQELYVERGYRAADETLIVQLVLAGLGALLMLGGTLTATFLALSDARPDLATLSAVGASPRTRRGVAAAYALVVGFVGAVLGAAVGFVPGLAVARPLTTMQGDSCVVEGSGSCTPTNVDVGPFVDVPWLLVLGIVVALPLLTAAVVGLTARSRLPLVARLS
ncbi:ABC transporter permease [Nocardioides sp. W7]|uniref:ABC transporter permease n=1 Tax=Nocardioides sp. W7 TaxID=2931390 RepID=UPI001FD61CCC|nr:ABC transporter permease [Nocardioides sp. W7]